MQGFQDFRAFYRDSKQRFNHLHHELPYRFFDDTTDVFENQKSQGFGIQLSVLGGGNDELILSLNKMLLDLPQGDDWDYHIAMFGGNHVDDLLDENNAAMSQRGGICALLAERETKYAKYAARKGWFHRQKHHFDLRRYHAYFFVSTTSGDRDRVIDSKEIILTALRQTGIDTEMMGPNDLISFVENTVNFDPAQPPQVRYDEWTPLYHQMISPDTEFLIHRDHIETRHTTERDVSQHNHLVTLGMRRLPGDFRLYALPECFTSLRNVANSLQCPHLVSLHFRLHETGMETQLNDNQISSLEKTVNSKLVTLVPTAPDELLERKALQKGMLDGQIALTSMMLTVTLMTNRDVQRRHVQAAKSAFSAVGIDVLPLYYLQSQSLFSCLPFLMSEGYWADCQRAGRLLKVKSSNLVSFFPIILDHYHLRGGMLLPTMRQHISFFDPFDCGSDNYNIALTGGSGAGKSFFVQQLAKMIYNKYGKLWILDKGKSYKKLTLMLGGTYMTAERIFLNPFTHLGQVAQGNEAFIEEGDDEHIDPLKLALDNITALFASMASPRIELTALQESVLGDAIVLAWERKHTETLVDDVQAAIFELAEQHKLNEVRHVGIQLNKYCTSGIYGDTFNKPSMLDPKDALTTLELDGFPDAVLRPAIFALMVTINQQMYMAGSRSTPKMCIIEEAWSLLSGSNAQARKFINTGYRTARKFGGSFCTVTQGIGDFFANAEAEASYNNSDIHITLRQGEGFNNFIKAHPKTFSSYEQTVIKNFDKSGAAGYSCALIKAGGHATFHRLFVDPFTRACLSTEPHEYEYCETLTQQGVPLMDAIMQTATHFYGDEITLFNREVLAEEDAHA